MISKQTLLLISVIALFITGSYRGRAQSDSVFSVDGLMVDDLGTRPPPAGQKVVPLSQLQKIAPPFENKPGAVLNVEPVQINLPPQGKAMDHLEAADVYARQKDWKKAFHEIQQGLDIEPDSLLLIRRAAVYAALSKNFGVADEYFRRFVGKNPRNVAFLTGHAGVLIRLLRFDEAEELAGRALAIDPHDLTARFTIACVKVAKGMDIAAGEWDGLSVAELSQVANWLDADRDDYVAALSAKGFTRFCNIVLGPESSEHVRDIIHLLDKTAGALNDKRWDEANDSILKLKALGVNSMGLRMEMGRIQYEKNDYEGARETLKAVADRYPEKPVVLYNYAYVLINTEYYDDAIKVLERAAQLDPEAGQITFALACAYAGQGKLDQAWPLLSDLADSHSNEFDEWMKGDRPYLRAIRESPPYKELMAKRQKAVSPTP